MKVAALFHAPGQPSHAVWLHPLGEWLVIEDQAGREIERWHFHSLEQATDAAGATVLSWPPHPTRLEIKDAAELQRANWFRRLPTEAHRPRMRIALSWLGGAAVLAAAIALSIPIAARHVPPRWERRLFNSVELYSGEKVCDPGAISPPQHALNKLARRLFPIYPTDHDLPIRFVIVREKQVNAVAFLAGRIYVYEGLLKEAESPEELAGVLAHEIEHEAKRHLLQVIFRESVVSLGMQVALLGGGTPSTGTMHALMRLKFGRGMEDEADRGGLQRLRDARISARGFQKFFERHHGTHGLMTLLSDHPGDDEREALVKSVGDYPSEPVLTAAEWQALKTYCAP